MSAWAAFLHLVGGLWVGLMMGLLAASFCKLLWRRAATSVAWWKLALAGSGASLAAWLMGLALLGQDGRMATYAAMCMACALAQAWLLRNVPALHAAKRKP